MGKFGMGNFRTQMYIDGMWTDAESGRRTPVYNPANREEIASVPFGGREDARRAVEAAHAAFASWSRMPAEERSVYLRRIYELIVARADRLAAIMTLEQGKP